MLATNAPQVLNLISTRLLGLHTHVGQINQQFGRMATLIGGVGAALAGAGILKGMSSIVDAGSKINHELELMKNQSFQVKDINDAMAAAMDISGKVQQTTVAENLKHIRELRYAFGDTADAVKWLDVVSKANIVANSYAATFGRGDLKDQVFDLVKGLEMKGLTATPADFARMMDVWIKAMVASGGKVTAANFLGTMKYARTAGLLWDETFMGQYLPRLMQEYSTGGSGGAGGPGNALMSAFKAIVGGTMSTKSGHEWERMGLSRVERQLADTVIMGGMTGYTLFERNPYEWVQQILMPALAAHGITKEEDVTTEISQMISNRTAADIITKMALQGRYMEGLSSPFEKDAALARMAHGVLSSYDELSMHDWQTNMLGFHAQFENLVEMLGAPVVGDAVNMLRNINDAMAGLARLAGEHPTAIKYTLEAIAAIGAGLVVGGIVAVIAAIGALAGVAAGIAAAATAIGLLAALNWDHITNAVRSFGQALAILHDPGAALGKMLGDWLFPRAPGPGASSPPPGASAPLTPWDYPGITPMNYNAVPPPSGAAGSGMSAAIYMDGQKVGELVTRRIADRGSRPTEGSAHFDPTWGAWPADVRA